MVLPLYVLGAQSVPTSPILWMLTEEAVLFAGLFHAGFWSVPPPSPPPGKEVCFVFFALCCLLLSCFVHASGLPGREDGANFNILEGQILKSGKSG